MSSTNKTEHLRLNKWIGSDIPQMADFNSDNAIIDNAISTHFDDDDIHITAEEREKWNNAYYIFTYYGNGSYSRNITINVDFVPSWGIVFAVGKTPSVADFDNTSNYNYFAITTQNGGMPGVSLVGTSLSLQQSPTAILGDEYRNFNEISVTYVCIVFA